MGSQIEMCRKCSLKKRLRENGFCWACDREELLFEKNMYEKKHIRTLEACKELQAGGEFAYLLQPGDSITTHGPLALMDEVRRLKAKMLGYKSLSRV